MAVSINAPGVTISATTSSSNVALPNSNTNGVMVVNAGTGTVFLASGGSTVTATTSGVALQANWRAVFYKNPGDTYVAAITPSGTATVYFTPCDIDSES